MKKRVYLFAILIGIPFLGSAQWAKHLDYGTGLNFNIPAIKPKAQDTLSVRAGWGFSLFGEYQIDHGFWLASRIGYDQTKYYHDYENLGTTFNSGTFSTSMLTMPAGFSGTRFEMGMCASYSFRSRREVLDPSRSSGVRTLRRRPEVKSDLGLFLGIAFDLKPQFGLKVTYTEFLLSQQKTNRTTGRPDQLQVTLDIRFNRLGELASHNAEDSAFHSLLMLSQEGTMVFMLPTRQSEIRAIKDSAEQADFRDELRKSQLLLAKYINRNYNFSDFVICYDTSVKYITGGHEYKYFLDSNLNYVEATPKLYMLFGYSGENFYSEFRRWSTGMYIYNRDFQIMPEPFPSFTQYPERDNVMDDAQSVSRMINRMNSSLFLSMSAFKPQTP